MHFNSMEKKGEVDVLAALRNKIGAGKRNKTGAVRKIARNKATINELQHSLNTNPKFTKMVAYSVECLTKLAVDQTSIEEMLDDGVLDNLLKVVRLNPFNEEIMQLINKALQTFCINDDIARRIGQKLGGEVFVNSLKKHTDPATIVSTMKTMSLLSGTRERRQVSSGRCCRCCCSSHQK